MAFHVSNYGSRAGSLALLVDLRGFVPEPGDSVDDFDYAAGWFDGDSSGEIWRTHLALCAAARAAADRALARWRRGE